MSGPDAPAVAPRRSWWRRNRAGVVVLPLALVLALAGNSSRVYSYFWSRDLREPVVAEQGSFAQGTATSVTSDSRPYERPVRVRLTGLAPATAWWGDDQPVTVPAGTRAVAVHLDVQAGQDADLTTCALEVVGADGTRYGYGVGLYSGGFTVGQTAPCLVPGLTGFQTNPFRQTLEEQPPRPDSWSVAPVVVVPAGVEITEVRLSWGPPEYLALRVAR